MSRTYTIYSLRDASSPDPNYEIQFGYDKNNPNKPVKVTFPEGAWTLTSDQITEIGVLCLAMSRKSTTPRVNELLQGFGLDEPAFLIDASTTQVKAEAIAEFIVNAFIESFDDVRATYTGNPELLKEIHEKIVTELEKFL